jgi:Zinc-finger of RNA-polymerase I-specific TFIIB, Rrn7
MCAESKRQAAFCQLCGQKIVGKGRSFRHKEWPEGVTLHICMECDREKPRCRQCGLPLAASTASGLCETCRDSLPACLACGLPVTGKSLEFDGAGPYCLDCYRTRPPCDICGAPLTDERWQLSDGRITCRHCHAGAVFTPDVADALYEQIKEVVFSQLGFELNIPTGLALVDRNQLKEVIRLQTDGKQQQAVGHQDLDPERTLGIYARRGMRRGIYIQTGLPRLLFLQVAAHEYAHAWQGENCPLLRDKLVHEGFAEWVAYHMVGYYGYRDSQERMLARQDSYGQGLKWALSLEQSQGAQTVVNACRNMV